MPATAGTHLSSVQNLESAIPLGMDPRFVRMTSSGLRFFCHRRFTQTNIEFF